MKLLSLLVAPFVCLSRALRTVLVALFGRICWTPPGWLSWLGRHPLVAFALLLGLLGSAAGGWYGWNWYRHLPQPHTVDYKVIPPALTDYEKTPVKVDNLSIRFTESVAPLDQVGKTVNVGLLLEPAHPGTWHWATDRLLTFTPKGDWPVGTIFTIALSKTELLAPKILLRDYQTTWTTAPFMAQIDTNLYQEPGDPRLKKMVATINFSHPVDQASLKQAINLKLGEGLVFRDKDVATPWSLTVDKTGRHAYVHSAPLAMPQESTKITLTLGKGVTAAMGSKPSQLIEKQLAVPGRYQLTFNDVATRYVNNSLGEPQQVLMFNSSFPVSDEMLNKHVRGWLLPEKEEPWSPSTINQADIKKAQNLQLTQIPGAEALNSHHSFSFHAPVKRLIFVEITEQVEAIGGYLSKKANTTLLNTGEYPKQIKLLGEGALLSLGGEKRLGFMVQGIAGMKVEIARLLPRQYHQLIDQNSSKFATPTVYSEQLDRLVERVEYTREFPDLDPAKPLYDSIDLSTYLNAEGGRRGVFVIRLTPFDPQHPDREYSEYSGDRENGDRRFILVTDLGLISKRTLDGGQDVFVQSISSGVPVENAKVEVMGRNGLPLAEAHTDVQGHARFPDMNALKREKTPIMITASIGNDISFLPLGRDEHQVDFTRFDIGGASNQNSPDQLSAFLFTDRGIYRPGETAHIASILRAADWNTRLEGIPVEVEITDPRGVVAWNQQRSCPASGFDSVDFTSNQTSLTGEYTASIYLLKNNKRNSQLGSATFKVRDFEPDRIKVDLSLAQKPVIGWLQPEDVKPVVKARHLFGADASDRRVTAKMQLSPTLPAFKQYPNLRFHIDTVFKESIDEELPETLTSATGEGELNPNLGRFAQATYRLRLTARVYEAEGGRNVAAEQEAMVSSAPYLIGVGSEDALDYVPKGAARKSRWLAVGSDLKVLPVNGLQLVLIEHRHVSVLAKQPDDTYKYESRRKDIERSSAAYNLAQEGANLSLPTEEPGDFSYEMRDQQGAVLNRISWTVAGTGNVSRSLDRNALLQIKLDKSSYAPGETIKINIRAPYNGSGLITIERDKVYAHTWFKTSTNSSVQSITVPKELEGNGYVNVQFVRDLNSAEIFMSPLSSGAAPFSVNLDARKLPMALTAPPLVQPGQELKMIFKPGEASKAVIFAIDEGILQVARYKTANPLGYFFQKRMLDVQTSQILSLILPEFSRLMAAAAPGGDGEDLFGSHINPFKRKGKPPERRMIQSHGHLSFFVI